MSTLGLVLSGGGARGAYQAGVLKAIAEISARLGISNPFQIYTGVSAGALNISLLASHSRDFTSAAQDLCDLWCQLTPSQVFHGDIFNLSKSGVQWMTTLSLGGFYKAAPSLALLDTSPLRQFILENCSFPQIQKNLEQGKFQTVAITAMSYNTTNTVTFVQSNKAFQPWTRVRRHSENSVLSLDHILASASIPILFPPVSIGREFFGDGCIRNQTPCGPAISLGAQRMIAIGVRKKQDLCYAPQLKLEKKITAPTIARVANVLLSAVMMDGMEIDIERIERTNLYLERLSASEREVLPLKNIPNLWISPSQDISGLALNKAHRLPPMLRYLMRGLGSLEEASELVSFLLFDAEFCKQLIDLGYKDAFKEEERIRQILKPAQPKRDWDLDL